MAAAIAAAAVANERTFLSWTRQGITLGGFGIGLICYGEVHGKHRVVVIGGVVVCAAILMAIYSLWHYMNRAGRIHRRESNSFHDSFGPTIYTALLLVVMGLTLAYHMTPVSVSFVKSQGDDS